MNIHYEILPCFPNNLGYYLLNYLTNSTLNENARLNAMKNLRKNKVSEKMSACLGGYYVSCQKRLYKMKYGLKGAIFKCQSWPALAKQPIV